MSDTKDGGPAFPEVRIRQDGDPIYHPPTKVYYQGMSLRDWFAGQALAALVGRWQQCNETFSGLVARQAYQYADEMLRARAQPKERTE